ncbi:hydroxyethylthiazole kinase [Butyrivibrio sp. JL13D10]|uniref:hydroxyethylthiazole kinase n=1 Tax=Butyrivibrio sp. JL13D10 TaxID=3236815 RepID=UPI0038B5124F
MAELIHCITNPISMMQCANAVLSLGAKPIMAEHPMEVREITETASALLLNMGNISDTRIESMKISYEIALSKEIPIVLDAVGVACSKLRRNLAMELVSKYESEFTKSFFLIKGNYSEIKALYEETYRGVGVDADDSLEASEIADIASELAARYKTVILATGPKDIVADDERTFFVSNGNPMMGQITGTGCMLGAICATFLSRQQRTEAVINACGFFGMAGEVAYKKITEKKQKPGAGSFLVELLNAISTLDEEKTIAMIKIETA